MRIIKQLVSQNVKKEVWNNIKNEGLCLEMLLM